MINSVSGYLFGATPVPKKTESGIDPGVQMDMNWLGPTSCVGMERFFARELCLQNWGFIFWINSMGTISPLNL